MIGGTGVRRNDDVSLTTRRPGGVTLAPTVAGAVQQPSHLMRLVVVVNTRPPRRLSIAEHQRLTAYRAAVPLLRQTAAGERPADPVGTQPAGLPSCVSLAIRAVALPPVGGITIQVEGVEGEDAAAGSADPWNTADSARFVGSSHTP